MLLIRPVKPGDLDAIYTLAKQGGIGITTLPPDKTMLKTKIANSRASFSKTIDKPHEEIYFFVLEDTETGLVHGTAAIEASVGNSLPFYSYKISQVMRMSHDIGIKSSYQVLTLVNDYQGKTELCTLYLDKKYRKKGAGLFLSRSRFLFMADHLQRFTNTVFAEMRGVSDKEGRSPFWDALGKHFFQMPFAEADRLTTLTNKQFIADLMPRSAIYTSLLSKKAQKVIGKPHRSTKRAMKILEKEGFHFTNYVDVFDAGPTIEANLKQVKTIKHSDVYTIQEIAKPHNSELYMLANRVGDYRCCLCAADIIDDQQLIISRETAKALKVKIGDTVRLIAF